MKKISDGWHEIYTEGRSRGFYLGDVYTINGVIVRATKGTGNERVPASVYRRGYCGLDSKIPCKYSTFRVGVREGKYTIR